MSTTSLGDLDHYLISEGTHRRLFDKLGAHPGRDDRGDGTRFAVRAPHAREVSVVGDFNNWDPAANRMVRAGWNGIWEAFVPGIGPGARYKYAILPQADGDRLMKADPFAFAADAPPDNASKVWDLGGYKWGDAEWMTYREGRNSLGAPISIYEVHLGSWKHRPDQGNRWLSYRELATELADYVSEMGFTHVELMPLAEAPFYGSWGYQVTGYYAASARYGTPQDLMFLVDTLHQRGIGVILDWVPAHFPRDAHGLAEFDGEPLFEYPDPKKGRNEKWNTSTFNFGDPQVANFLIANALFWLETYHIDGLRVDAVEAMVRLDFGKGKGDWEPNARGGPENLEAIAFLKEFNQTVHAEFPGCLTIAEDPTTTPDVTKSVGAGGMGFDLKWDLGWVHDTVNQYLRHDPIHRKGTHDKLIFRMHYAFNEHYLLPLSHDEVVKGQRSLIEKMPGDEWQQFANLRLLYGYMFTLPGKKLLFMGDEFAQRHEWDHDNSLDWHLLDDPRYRGIRRWVRDLNTQYRALPTLHHLDHDRAGFAWVDAGDREQSVLAYLRRDQGDRDQILVVCNFTPVARQNYRIGVPRAGHWEEILNSDAALYGGGGKGNMGGVDAAPIPWHGRNQSVNLTLPPLAMIALKSTRS